MNAVVFSYVWPIMVRCPACWFCFLVLVQVQNRFEGGLTGEQARALEDKLEKELLRAEALVLEADRHKEIADIASEQTQAMNHHVSHA